MDGRTQRLTLERLLGEKKKRFWGTLGEKTPASQGEGVQLGFTQGIKAIWWWLEGCPGTRRQMFVGSSQPSGSAWMSCGRQVSGQGRKGAIRK